MPNMTIHGVSGVLMRFTGHMGRVCRNISFGLGEFSSHTRFELGDDSKLDSGMTSSVGIRSIRIFSHICIVLLA